MANYAHNQRYIINQNHIKEITAANERVCSFEFNNIPSHISDADENSFYYQENGKNLCHLKAGVSLLHWERDQDQIKSLLEATLAKEREVQENRIKEKVAVLQKQIDSLLNQGDEESRAFNESEAHIKQHFKV